MDEQQLIGDILDKLYGYDSALREEDSEIIKAKKKEKDEKTKDLKTQINNICKDLENELKAVLGPDVSGIKKIIRLQVLTSIKAEIDNGNNVVDSNGKISIGKTFDIIRQSKSEILEKIQDENDTVNYKKEDGDIVPEDSKEDKGLNNFFDKLDDAGIDLSQDEKDLMAEAVARVNEIMNMIREKVDSGMSNVEALKSILRGMSKEEIELLRAQFILAGQCKVLDSLLENEKNSPKNSPKTEKAGGKEDSSKKNTKESTYLDEEPSKNKSNLLPNEDEIQGVLSCFDSACEQLGVETDSTIYPNTFGTKNISQQVLDTIGLTNKFNGEVSKLIYDKTESGSIRVGKDNFDSKVVTLNEVIKEQMRNISLTFQGLEGADVIYGNNLPKQGHRTWDIKKEEDRKIHKERYATLTPETTGESAIPKKEETTPVAETITEKLKRVKAMMDEERYTTLTPETEGESTIPKKGETTPVAETITEKLKRVKAMMDEERYTTLTPETEGESTIPKKGEASAIALPIAEQIKSYTTPLHEMSHSTIERKIINEDGIDELLMSSKISDKDIGPYFDRYSELFAFPFSREDMYAEHFMSGELEGGNGLAEMRGDDTEIVDEPASVTPASAPISTTPPRSAPTSIVEEITVDESGVTQEGKSEPNKNGILSVRDIMALVENQAEVRKMLEANGIIHGQMPEGPTTGKPETQGAPVADNDEKSGEGPEEH